MFSKEESQKMRREFWISFGKSFPTKWTLYRTKIKDFGFKFHFDTKKAMVMLDIEDDRSYVREHYYQKILSLSSLLKECVPGAEFSENVYLDSGKQISRVALTLEGVSIHNRDTWQTVMVFLNEKMMQFEQFWQEYKEVVLSNPPLME